MDQPEELPDRSWGLCERLPTLYAWQEEAFEAWLATERRGIVEAVTGTGKTTLGLMTIGEALADGRKATVLVHTQELQRQWRSTLRLHLPGRIRIGQLGGGHNDSFRNHDVVVAIVNSARVSLLEPPSGSLVVADECHHYASTENRRALSAGYERRLGLTATLHRSDQMEEVVLERIGPLCHVMGFSEAISDEVTAHFTVALIGVKMTPVEQAEYRRLTEDLGRLANSLVNGFGIPRTPFHRFLSDVKRLASENYAGGSSVASAFLSALHQRRSIVSGSPRKIQVAAGLADAVKAADRALVFTETTDAAEEVCDGLTSQGVFADTVHSGLSREDRRENLRAFRSDRLDALVAARVLDEGVDLPVADLAIVVSGSQTRRQMVQRLGRVLRRKPDDRLARLAVLFLEGTVEDPRNGGHEVFLGEALQICDDYKIFDESQLENACEFLAFNRAEPAPGPPRRLGEVRGKVDSVELDDEVDVASFLAAEFRPGPASFLQPQSETLATSAAGPMRGRLSGEHISRLRNAAHSAHPYATTNDVRMLESHWGRLVADYGEQAALAGVRSSLRIEIIEETARIVSARLAGETSSGRGVSRQKASRTSRGRRPRRPGTTPTVAADAGRAFDRPVEMQRICRACGCPEISCAC